VYRAYAGRLVARLPKPPSGSLSHAAVLGATDWQVRMSEEDAGAICLVVSTAEHCQEMVRQLSRALAAKLEPQQLASRWARATRAARLAQRLEPMASLFEDSIGCAVTGVQV
jgi:hypothetical protein